ncbi:Ferritin-like domain-containing protein [Hymenobacter daecheongensis DSM 21074]|uniref:Ferritin-like domain-containing protein n=2 Tax=Hymenobacter daecheongensis TaxID=496053 RepID=A0A1M6CZ36_9BACT|nr:Ferritin-like domain-containing protein [Hymenobacter daecheongensis DSM 21074]
MQRRSFFRVAGATVAASTLVLAGCGTDDPTPTTPAAGANVLTLAAGEVGLLNYAYILEQLEAAFYQKVVDAPPADLRAGEKEALTELRDHEVIHREFLKFALADKAIGTIEFNFSSVTFTTREGVFTAAKKLEDLGVAAYAGVGKLLSGSYLALLAKIASVEARHAAYVRDALQPNSFGTPDAGIIATTGDYAGLNVALTPAQAMAAAAPFLNFTVDVSQLPTT